MKRDLVDEVTDRLRQDRIAEASPPAVVSNVNEQSVTLSGGGATFPVPIYQQWFASFNQRHPAWKVSYRSLGSEEGVRELTSGHLDFAGTDIPPSYLGSSLHDASFFPTVGGAVVLTYNLPQFTGELHLSGEIIADMLSGRVRSWRDSKLMQLNPAAALPDELIRVFTRSDGSGTTFALTDYLSEVDTRWQRDVGATATVQWHVGTSLKDNDQLAQAVANTPFSLGYVEFIYAFQHHLPFASVSNRSGRYIRPGLLSIMAAANWAGDRRQDLNFSITNSPEPMAYPISNVTRLAVSGNLSPEKRAAMHEFLKWMLTSGQRQFSALGYSPLPRNLIDQEMPLVDRFR